MALTTLAKAKEYLGKTDSTHDSILTDLVNGVSDSMEQWMRRQLTEHNVSDERHSVKFSPLPASRPHIALVDWPVSAISQVTRDGSVVPASEYRIESGRLLTRQDSNGNPIDWEHGDYAVDYTAGYSDIPSGLEHAATAEVAFRFKSSDPGGARIGKTSSSFASQGVEDRFERHRFLPSTIEAMRPYRRRT